MPSKKVSFVIPYFNCHWVTHAIESAQKQTYPLIEIVVVDDGSTDLTHYGVEKMAANDTRISWVRLPKNVGRSEARNIGNGVATGDLICVLDADDLAYPERAALTVKALSNADFVHGSCDYIDAIGTKLGTHYADVFNKSKAIKEGVNRMVHSTCGYRKEFALSNPYLGGDAAKLGLDDWCLQLSAAFSGAKMEHISTVIGAYRDIETGVSKTRDHAEVVKFKEDFIKKLEVSV